MADAAEHAGRRIHRQSVFSTDAESAHLAEYLGVEEPTTTPGRVAPQTDAGRQTAKVALRRLIAATAEREDPYAGADRENAVRIVALVWLLSGLLALAFLPFDSPTRPIGDAGWVVAVAVIGSQFAGGILLRLRGQEVGFGGLLAVTYLGMLQTGLLQWLGSGWQSPYSQILLLWLGCGAGIHPPRRALTVFFAVVAVSLAPLLYLGWDSSGIEAAATETLMWTVLGLIVLILMVYVRGQRVALRDERESAVQLAHSDSLTGLGNRRAFDELLGVEIARARRSGVPLSVAIIDLDGFKDLNDRLGHLEGDRCLRSVATALDETKRRGDHVFRWGGDEFAIVLPGADLRQAQAAVDRLTSLDPPIKASDGQLLGFCTGIAELDQDMTAGELLARADLELFASKQANDPSHSEPDGP